MPITAKLDELGLPAWIALIVLGFMVWWPLGLGTLAFVIGSGRMGCGRHSVERWENKMARMQDKIDEFRNVKTDVPQGGVIWVFAVKK